MHPDRSVRDVGWTRCGAAASLRKTGNWLLESRVRGRDPPNTGKMETNDAQETRYRCNICYHHRYYRPVRTVAVFRLRSTRLRASARRSKHVTPPFRTQRRLSPWRCSPGPDRSLCFPQAGRYAEVDTHHERIPLLQPHPAGTDYARAFRRRGGLRVQDRYGWGCVCERETNRHVAPR